MGIPIENINLNELINEITHPDDTIDCTFSLSQNNTLTSICKINKRQSKHSPTITTLSHFGVLFILSTLTFFLGWIFFWTLADYITEITYPSTDFTFAEQMKMRLPYLAIFFIGMVIIFYYIVKKMNRNPIDHV